MHFCNVVTLCWILLLELIITNCASQKAVIVLCITECSKRSPPTPKELSKTWFKWFCEIFHQKENLSICWDVCSCCPAVVTHLMSRQAKCLIACFYQEHTWLSWMKAVSFLMFFFNTCCTHVLTPSLVSSWLAACKSPHHDFISRPLTPVITWEGIHYSDYSQERYVLYKTNTDAPTKMFYSHIHYIQKVPSKANC